MANMDKVAIITGASSGIGRAIALHLAERGCRVVLAARGADKLAGVRDEIAGAGGQVAALPTDVAKLEDMQALVDYALAEFGRVDVMINNAGSMPLAPMTDIDTAGWERMIDVNLKGVLWAIAAALPRFREQGSGHFVTIGSTAAVRMNPNLTVYGGTKAAVRMVMEGLRQELAGKVRVTTVHPGFTHTDFASHIEHPETRELFAGVGEGLSMSPFAVARAVAHAIEQDDAVNISEMIIRASGQV